MKAQYYQKEKQLKEEYLITPSSLSQKYQKQDLKDLYSMINLFEQLIIESTHKLKREKISQEYMGSALDKK